MVHLTRYATVSDAVLMLHIARYKFKGGIRVTGKDGFL
jgi:hypothetical protein